MANLKIFVIIGRMPDGLTGFVTDSIVHFVSAFLMLRCFLPPTIKKRGGPLVVCACLYLIIGIVVETILHDWIREGTLVFLFFFFILLANRVCKLPLLHAWGALFCHFSLMLWLGVVDVAPRERPPQSEPSLQEEPDLELDRLLEAGILEDAPPTPTPKPDDPGKAPSATADWVDTFHDRMLHRTLVKSRLVLRGILYQQDKPVPGPSPTPTPIPTPQPIRPTPVPGSRMEPEEFFLLFSPTPTPFPPGESNPVPDLPTPTPVQGENVVNPNDSVAVNSDQLNNMVKLRNRSTDSNYLPPVFEIDALGIGTNRRYAIVDGTLMREGNIIRMDQGTVRGWRLVKIKEGELFWQPLL